MIRLLTYVFPQVDAQNKFMGKSFEIRPTGVAHAELLLPEEWAPDYPKCTAAGIQGKVVEHYSWKKVTTNVSGFILGYPSIDHYGDMIVSVSFIISLLYLKKNPGHEPPHRRPMRANVQATRMARQRRVRDLWLRA
jgi:hypothetical protein